MSRVLPILFNTEMVQAILDDRKTVTRRCVKYKYSNTEMKMHTDKYGTRLIEIQKDIEGETHGKNPDGSTWQKLLGYVELKALYKRGDILYVRETWLDYVGRFMYKADCDKYRLESLNLAGFNWRPSIHMPKEAARIFLKVKDVRAERLKDAKYFDFIQEGLPYKQYEWEIREDFQKLWNSTIKKSDLDSHGWDANPWVWVIEFERCEKPESEE